jgi:hypothetical protein
MPISKKKDTTSSPTASTPESSALSMPDQQAFHQYLRPLAQSAVRPVIEAVMIEELDSFERDGKVSNSQWSVFGSSLQAGR